MKAEEWRSMIQRGCGYACPYRDGVNGTCEKHGPTNCDLIVAKVTDGFRADLRRILGAQP